MRALHGDIAIPYGTPEQRVKAVNLDLRTRPQKLIGYHSNVPWATAKSSLIIRTHMSINAENLTKIGLVLPEIFSEIYDNFRRIVPTVTDSGNLPGYQTKLHQICTQCS